MSYQVVVKLGDRVWDSIRDTKEQALMRVCEHMRKDESGAGHTAKLVQLKLMFGKGIELATLTFEGAGFSVEFKEVGSA